MASEYRCRVGHLGVNTTERTLEPAFSKYGEVVHCEVITDRDYGRSRGFGFVTFKDEKSMKDAIEGMNGQELDGHIITVEDTKSHGIGSESVASGDPGGAVSYVSARPPGGEDHSY